MPPAADSPAERLAQLMDPGQLSAYLGVPVGTLAAIRPLDVPESLARMQADGLSASRCRQGYHLLGSICETAVQDGRIPASPCKGIKLP